jgi:folate-binding protein YgfZ
VVSVLEWDEDGILLVGQAEDPLIVRQWVEKFIVMENITVSTVSDDFVHFIIYDAVANLKDILASIFQFNHRIFEEVLAAVRPVHILTSKSLSDVTIRALSEAGIGQRETHEFVEYSVLNGIPAFPNELSSLYNPLEAGLSHLVSFTKGCYIGQEVVARLDTYNKVQKHLVRLRMDDLPAELPARLYFEGTEWGSVTSALKLRDSNECRGLGYVKILPDEPNASFYFLKESHHIKLIVDSNEF